MQCSGYRGKSQALVWGLSLGALVVIAGFGISCSPGGLDCDLFPCQAGGSGGQPMGGSGGSPRMDASAGSGGMGGMGGAPGGAVTLATAITGCNTMRLGEMKTVGEVETKFLKPTCGTEAACHTTTNKATFPPDMQADEMFKRLVNVPAAYLGMCKDAMVVYVGPTNPAMSYLVSKVKDAMPKCDGKMGGARMPFTKPPLPMDEIDCIEKYAVAIAGYKP